MEDLNIETTTVPKRDKAGKSKNERDNRRHPRGRESQTRKNELARMGNEAIAFGLALRRSNHGATETSHLNLFSLGVRSR